jgi:hypothetical protein
MNSSSLNKSENPAGLLDFLLPRENRERLGTLVTLAYFKKIRALSMIECLQDMEI